MNGTFSVSAGTLAAAGSSGMAEAPDTDSGQGWVSATFDSAYPAGTVVQFAAGDEVIATWTADKDFSSLVFSSGAITSGETYTVHVGGTASGPVVGGLALGGSTSGASQLGTVSGRPAHRDAGGRPLTAAPATQKRSMRRPTSRAARFSPRKPTHRVIRMTAGTFPRSSPCASARRQNHVARTAGRQNTARRQDERDDQDPPRGDAVAVVTEQPARALPDDEGDHEGHGCRHEAEPGAADVPRRAAVRSVHGARREDGWVHRAPPRGGRAPGARGSTAIILPVGCRGEPL